MTKITKLLIDDREKKSRQKWVIENYHQLDPVVEHLDFGDYHYLTDSGKRVVFEYKTGEDFLKSIRDAHLHNQLYMMCTHYPYNFIQVTVPSWNELFKKMWYQLHQDFNMNDVMGAVARFNKHSTVLVNSNRRESFDMMLKQAGKMVDGRPLSIKHTKKSPNPALNYLNDIYGLNDKTSLMIVKSLGLRTLTDLLDLTYDDLVSVDGIASKKATLILKNIWGDDYEKKIP